MSNSVITKVKTILSTMKVVGNKKEQAGYAFFKDYMAEWVEPSDIWNDACECESKLQSDCICGYAGASTEDDVLEALDGRSYSDRLDETFPDEDIVHRGFHMALDEFAQKMGFKRLF